MLYLPNISTLAMLFCGVGCQRRQWLSEAIDSLQGSQPIKVMLEDIQVILAADDDEEAVERKEEAPVSYTHLTLPTIYSV